MKNLIRNTILILACGIVSGVYGAMPAMSVIVRDSAGKTAYKGATDGKGMFVAGALKPGQYVVQFNSPSAPKTSRYALIATAGKEKVVANGIEGAKLAAGVAVTIKIAPGSNLTAQITAEDKNSAPIGRNGKLMVWIPKQIGSNLSPHWAESDSAEAKQAMTSGSYSTKNIQDKQAQGITPSQTGNGR